MISPEKRKEILQAIQEYADNQADMSLEKTVDAVIELANSPESSFYDLLKTGRARIEYERNWLTWADTWLVMERNPLFPLSFRCLYTGNDLDKAIGFLKGGK